MKAEGCFIPNLKNTGGCDCLDEIMFKHHERMLKVKSAIKITPPFVKPKRVAKFNGLQVIGNTKYKVRKSKKSSAVVVLPMNLPINREKNNYTLKEHMKEIANLHKKLERVRTADVRSKE